MISFTVYGKPQPGGSKKAWKNPKTDRIIMSDANPKAKDWKTSVATVAGELMAGRDLLEGPLRLSVTFVRARPAGHFGKRGDVKESAPAFPTTRPDCTKLLRPLEDALTGIVWRDDSQIVSQIAEKVFGEPERAEVNVSPCL